MSHTARQLVQSLSARTVPTTMRVERVDEMKKVVRVVASFNRTPTGPAAKAALEAEFKNKLEVIPGSFRVRQNGQRVHVAGFLRAREQARPIAEAASLKEIASNVYMDPSDNSIWTPQNGQIVRTMNESLAELASVAEVTKNIHQTPAMAAVSVKPFAGPKNTMIIAYVDPEEPSCVKTGVRIDEDNVWNEDDGITELSEDLIVDTESLDGADLEPTLVESASVSDPQSMIDYYSKVYAYDPAYLESVRRVIETRALV